MAAPREMHEQPDDGGEAPADDHKPADAASSSDNARDVPRGAGRRVAGHDPAKREQILDGAKRCFMSTGFDAASMNEIAAEAGVSKGTLYVYFQDKETLFGAICDRERGKAMQFIQRELDQSPDIETALLRFGTAVSTRLTADDVLRAMRMVLGVAEQMPRLAHRFFGYEPFSGVAILKTYLDARVLEGELDIADTELAARQFIDLAMSGVFKRRLFGIMPDPPDPAYVAHGARMAVEMFLGYYRPVDRAARR